MSLDEFLAADVELGALSLVVKDEEWLVEVASDALLLAVLWFVDPFLLVRGAMSTKVRDEQRYREQKYILQ